MAIAYESQATVNSSGATATISKPSGTVSGDLLVAVVGFGTSTTSITAPSGWTTVENYANAASYSDASTFAYKIAGGSEPSTYSWTPSSSGTYKGAIQRFSGVDTYGGVGSAALMNNASCQFGSVTPDENGCLLVLCGSGYYTGTPATPSGYSNAALPGTASGTEAWMASRIQATAAATGTITSTSWNAFSNYYQRGNQLWFRPVGGGGGSIIPQVMSHRRLLGCS